MIGMLLGMTCDVHARGSADVCLIHTTHDGGSRDVGDALMIYIGWYAPGSLMLACMTLVSRVMHHDADVMKQFRINCT